MRQTLWPALRSRPHLMTALAAVVACGVALPSMPPLTRALVAWDVGAVAYLAMCAAMFARTESGAIADLAEAQEAGEWTVFAITVLAVIASFAAVVGAFSAVKGASPGQRGVGVGLVAGTLLLSWLGTHTVFALRYAHEYYDRAPGGVEFDRGLEFPGQHDPDYWDFFYFAVVVGMTFQVSDVEIASRKLRRLATVHSLLSFLFNTVIIALTVNIAASLL